MGKAEEKIEAELRAAGEAPDEALDLARLALAFAALDRPGVARAAYEKHLAELVRAFDTALARGRTPDKIADKSGGNAPAEALAELLSSILAGRFSYDGDSENYDDPKNASLMHVIDRRKGLPVTLGILYLHVGQALGLDICGLNFPGHFVLRLRAGRAGRSRRRSSIPSIAARFFRRPTSCVSCAASRGPRRNWRPMSTPRSARATFCSASKTTY